MIFYKHREAEAALRLGEGDITIVCHIQVFLKEMTKWAQGRLQPCPLCVNKTQGYLNSV